MLLLIEYKYKSYLFVTKREDKNQIHNRIDVIF
jgi:hypothetical protein